MADGDREETAMPDIDTSIWMLIGAGALAAIGLIVAIASRRGREQVEQEHTIRRSQTLRVSLVVLLIALVIGFAVSNSHNVVVDWVFTETQAPMVMVIALSVAAGFLIGSLITSRRSE
jgi:uncharacterized integral membrane protein